MSKTSTPKKSKKHVVPIFLPNFNKHTSPQLFPQKDGIQPEFCFFAARFFFEARYVTTYRAMWDESPETWYFHCKKQAIFHQQKPWDHEEVGETSVVSHIKILNIPRYETSVDVIYQVMLCQFGIAQRFCGKKPTSKRIGLIFLGSWAAAVTKKSNYTKKRNSFSP